MNEYNDVDCCFDCVKQFNDELCKNDMYCKTKDNCSTNHCSPGACKDFKKKEETVTITKAEYEELVQDSNFLEALRCTGIDNWRGYSEAIDILREWDEEE